MKKLLVALVTVCAAGSLYAQNARTFVSGNGVDTGTCAATAPCRSFAFAFTQTNIGGDIIALDSAGYGVITVTHGVNIISPPGILGAVTVPASGVGVAINAGATDIVRLSGLHINASGGSSTGIKVLGGACKRLEIRDTEISGLTTGVDVTVDIRMIAQNLYLSDYSTGVYLHGGTTAATTHMKVALLSPVFAGGNIGLKIDEGASFMSNGTAFFNTTPYQYANENFVSGCTNYAPYFTYASDNGPGQDNRNQGNPQDYTACATP